ncbi:MAG TPA: hypothetical protein VMO26_24340 [Vicinamibacterales bacterium]|nr:hypothetical protein [Vicinamibacterales bacterium]
MRMTADDLFRRWQERIERIRNELHYVFSTRRNFRDVQDMFRNNKQLNDVGSQAYEWLLGIWGLDAVMAVRRELDPDSNTVAMGTMLDEMAARAPVLTRRRYLSFAPDHEPMRLQILNRLFDGYGAVRPNDDRMADHLSPDGINGDREQLEQAAAPALEYANQYIAHRTPIDDPTVKVSDINDAIDSLEPVFTKYYAILVGPALTALEPTNIGDDINEAFKFPWYVIGQND